MKSKLDILYPTTPLDPIYSLRYLRHDVEKRRLYSGRITRLVFKPRGRPIKQPKKALTWMLVTVQSKTPTPSTEARRYEGESGNYGVPAALPLVSRAEVTFWAFPKVTQPVKSVDHNTGLSFHAPRTNQPAAQPMSFISLHPNPYPD
jgi:hypothetical protein